MKSKYLLLPAAAVISLALTGCSYIESLLNGHDDNELQYIPVQIDEDGDWSFVNKDGEIVLRDEFNKAPSAVVNGFFSAYENDAITIYKFDEKKPTALKDCEGLLYAGFFNEGLCPIVKPKQKIQIIDTEGSVKFSLDAIKGKHIVYCDKAYNEGLLRVVNEDLKIGFVDKKGNCVIDPKYDDVSGFSDGLLIVNNYDSEKEKNSYSVINKKGEKQFSLKKGMSPVTNFNDGIFFVKDEDGRMYYYDTKGELTKLPTKVKYVGNNYGKLFPFEDDDQWGLMNLDGEIMIRAKYKSLYIDKGGRIIANKDNKSFILDKNGDEKAEIDDYNWVVPIYPFGLLACDDNAFDFLNTDGEKIKGANFNNLCMDRSLSAFIHSDYFDVNSMAKKIAQAFTTNGVRGYKLGDAPATHADGTPEQFMYRTNMYIENLDLKGFRWTATGMVMFSQAMADWNFSPTYDMVYFWNPNSHLNSVIITVNTETVIGADGAKAVADALVARGFKIVERPSSTKSDANAYYLLKGGNNILLLSYNAGSKKLELDMRAPSEDMSEAYLADFVRRENGRSASDSEVAVADDCVVEETVVEEEIVY